MPEADTAPLPKKTRVRVTEALRGVPEGTAGTVRGVVGLAFPRHRVEFDNGHFVTSVARTSLVRDDPSSARRIRVGPRDIVFGRCGSLIVEA